jgi:alanyl-tRNA synthetase
MTANQIRQSFLDFFRSKQHTLVPSSSLLPDAPNLLFTNAGMNQFVPIFLGERAADVDRWPGAVPAAPTRAADTQKCIRAGGKHNDLEDVGLDTYHHTFFEMLGNWSFGDYFKQEAIAWAWGLITEVWKFPKHRLYATVYQPDPAHGDPAEFDQEAYDHWARIFTAAGLDPAVHIVRGGKKDNFWMMGTTGPCGPCSELHVDLTPQGDTRGVLVNRGTAECIEIWNLVFIQFNADPDGSFSPLPAKHVDTGMGFERVTSILQCTKEFTDFSGRISNYETDIFRPLFTALERLCGKTYGSTLPPAGSPGRTEQERMDIAFRVIADHIRTLSFAIADGIEPGNADRHYVLRRILRRAVRYGRALGFHQPFFHRLAGVLADSMGHAFPELRERRAHIEAVIQREEEAFNKTLDRGIELFQDAASNLPPGERALPGAFAFTLYDTYGFPLDLTELMARERGLSVDAARFDELMEEQRQRARKAQKRTIVELSQIETQRPTRFIGFDTAETSAQVLEVVQVQDRPAAILDVSPCYAEMGGQVGDTGQLAGGGQLWRVVDTRKTGNVWLHFIETGDAAGQPAQAAVLPAPGSTVTLSVDAPRRAAIQRHHTVTHLLHWALHDVVSRDASQKGSYVGPEKLTFDFNSSPLSPAQIADLERLVNERILENAGVSWTEAAYADVKPRKDILQFFGEKYGAQVRVVQVGGRPQALDGYSMELCGGTHCRATGEIGLFRIVGESAIAAGVRRIEAVAGLEAWRQAIDERALLKQLATHVNAPVPELERKLEGLLAHQRELEKRLKAMAQKEAAATAQHLRARARNFHGVPAVIESCGGLDGDGLQAVADALKAHLRGVIVLGGTVERNVALVAAVAPDLTSRVQAGKIIQTIAAIVGGKGGGRPENARGGGKDPDRLPEALAKAAEFVERAAASTVGPAA